MQKELPRKLVNAYGIASVGVFWLGAVVLTFLGVVVWPYILTVLGYPDGEMNAPVQAILLFSLFISAPGFAILAIGAFLIWRADKESGGLSKAGSRK